MTLLTCSLTGEEFDQTLEVKYESPDSNGSMHRPLIAEFHQKLITITNLYGQIPISLMQRYGTNPLRTFTQGGENLRDVMHRVSDMYIRQGSEKAANV
jgi:hypothetical protein